MQLSRQLLGLQASSILIIIYDCFQIIEWYEEYAEEFFQTHTELGESLEISLALEQEVKQFEDSTRVSQFIEMTLTTVLVLSVVECV